MKIAVVQYIKKAIAEMARTSARMEANSACFFGFQSKEPPEIEKLRKF